MKIRDLLGEFLYGGTGVLVGGGYELRDTPLGFLGVECFFVEWLVASGHLVRGV